MNRRNLLATCGAALSLGFAGCQSPVADPGTSTTRSQGDGGSTTPPVPNDDRPGIEAVEDWPMFLYGQSNNRCFSGEHATVDEPGVDWTTATDGPIWGSPAVADDTLYVGSYDGHLYAISTATGKVEWRYRTGDRIDASPAVADGRVYVGSFDRNLYALDAETGAEEWIYGTDGIVRSSPTVRDGTVYVGAHCRTEECGTYYDVRWPQVGAIYALDAETGAIRWCYETGDGVMSTPSVGRDTVFVGCSDATLYAIDSATGSVRWRYETGEKVMSSPTIADGRIYVGNLDGSLYALTAVDGSVVWQYRATSRGTSDADLPVVVTGSPVVCDGTAYVGTVVPDPSGPYGKLYAISTSDGTHEWSNSPYAEGIGSSPALVGDVLYFGAHRLRSSTSAVPGVFALGTDGSERWRYTVDDPDHEGFGSSPAIVDGTLYIGGTDGRVYALDLDWQFQDDTT